MSGEALVLLIALLLISAGSVAGAYIYGWVCAKDTREAWHYAVTLQRDMWQKAERERAMWMKSNKELVDYNTRLSEYVHDTMQRELARVAGMPQKMINELKGAIYAAVATTRPKTNYVPPLKQEDDNEETQVVPKLPEDKKDAS